METYICIFSKIDSIATMVSEGITWKHIKFTFAKHRSTLIPEEPSFVMCIPKANNYEHSSVFDITTLFT